MARIEINPFDNDRLKTEKVQAMLDDLGVLPADHNQRPTFLRDHRTAAKLIDRALANVTTTPRLEARCSNPRNLAEAANVKFANGYATLASGMFTNIATNNAADGVYTVNGVSVPLTDIIDLNHPDNLFDPILDIDAGGIKARDNGDGTWFTRAFAIKAPLLTQLLASGFTVVVEFFSSASSEFGVSINFSVHDNAFNHDVGGGTRNDPSTPAQQTSLTDKDFNSTTRDDVYPPLGAISKLAITVASDRVSGCLNGGDVLTIDGTTGGLDPSLANIEFGFGGVELDRLRSFAFYEVIPDADLPGMSA